MAVALISHVGILGGSGTTATYTSSAINTIGASLLAFTISTYQGATGSYTITDSMSNTWSGLTAQSEPSAVYTRLWYAANPKTSPSHTFSIHVTAQSFPAGAVGAFTGVDVATAPFVTQSGHAQTTGSTNQTGSVTPTKDGSLIISGLGTNGTAITAYAINNSFTITDFNLNLASTYWGAALAYLVQGTAAAINPTWTFTGTTVDTVTTIAVFNPSITPQPAFTPESIQIWS